MNARDMLNNNIGYIKTIAARDGVEFVDRGSDYWPGISTSYIKDMMTFNDINQYLDSGSVGVHLKAGSIHERTGGLNYRTFDLNFAPRGRLNVTGFADLKSSMNAFCVARISSMVSPSHIPKSCNPFK